VERYTYEMSGRRWMVGHQWNVQDRDKERGRDVGRVVQHVSWRCAKVIPTITHAQVQVRPKDKAENED
jgi:hypothetical protein